MKELLEELTQKHQNYEIVFKLSSGDVKVYKPEHGDLTINPNFIVYTKGADTFIIYIDKIESIFFNPIF